MGSFPTVIRQLKFLVVGIDYFTKWVEVEALTTITEKNVRNFVWKNIICKYETSYGRISSASTVYLECWSLTMESSLTMMHSETFARS